MKIVLALAILLTLGSLGYTLACPQLGEKFTEFYILGLDGKATGYPQEIPVGEQGSVIVGIINREHTEVSYSISTVVNGLLASTTLPTPLSHGQKWEAEISFSPQEAGLNQKVEFILYKANEPYKECYLWLNAH